MNLLAFVMALSVSASSAVVLKWSMATSRHKTDDRVVVYRYASRFAPGLERAAYNAKIVVEWPYVGNKGMPATAERERMERLEDLLAPKVEADDFSVLVMVSTGENLRAWVYYAKSSDEFMRRLNGALSSEAPFPIDIELSVEPGWDEYERFSSGVKRAGEG